MRYLPTMKVIAEEDYQRIHEASLKILSEVGVKFDSVDALDVFKKHGARIENKTVFISPEMVKQSMDTAPETFKWAARNDEQSVILGEGYVVEPNVGCVYAQSIDKGRWPGTREDYANIQKLHQSSKLPTIVGATPIQISDAGVNEKHLYMLYETIKHTDKPVIGICETKAHVQENLKMMEIAMGESRFAENTCIAVSVNPLSPLAYGSETADSMVQYAMKGQAVMSLPCIMAGVTGPISIFGTIVLQNTEILAALVLTQLINPGNAFIMCPCSSTAYMKRGNYVTGAPEMMLIDIAGLQMSHEFYKLPSRLMTGMTDSKEVDVQAGYETMQNLVMGILARPNILHECHGVLESIMTLSYEKFIIDEELISRVLRIAEGIDTSDEAMSLDLIKEIGSEGIYFTHDETFKHYKDLWEPTVSDWHTYTEWKEIDEDILVKANRMWKKRLADAPEKMIDDHLEKELNDYIKLIRS
ncbi:MAG: trimethylamine methyltransferase family protein [Bacillota bacterium]|nr:trimethylamine methyltransferase family protein [Bacillota bacterium]